MTPGDLVPTPVGGPDEALTLTGWLASLREARATESLGELGPYELLAEIGRGGQGIIYRARDTRNGSVVALKRMLIAERDPSGAQRRLQTEVAAMRALSHPGVVRVRAVEAVGSLVVMAMEWVDGMPLDAWAAESPRDPRNAARLMAAVCDVLEHAHASGVVHRDLKPSNILVDRTGRPRVLDFGLAKLHAGVPDVASVSSPFLGTLAYAAPELIARGPSAVDARSDLYSVGVMLHELLVGDAPYDLGRSISTAVGAILGSSPAGLARTDLDPGLAAILRRALAKNPAERYASAAALATDLRAFADRTGPVLVAAPARRADAHPHPGRLRAVMLAAIAVVALAPVGLWALRDGLPRGASAATADQRAGAFLAVNDATAIRHGEMRDAAAERLRAVVAQVPAALRGQPLAEARVRNELAWRFDELAQWEDVLVEAGRARAILEAPRRPPGHDLATSLVLIGGAKVRTGRAAGADTLFERAIALERGRGTPDPRVLADAYSGLAMLRGGRPLNLAQAETEWALALRYYSMVEGPDIGRMRANVNYARMKARIGEFEEAVQSYRIGLDELRRLPAIPESSERSVLLEMSDALNAMGRATEAECALREAVLLQRGELDDYVPTIWSKLGSLALRRGAAGEAMRCFDLALLRRFEFFARELPDDPAFPRWAERLAKTPMTDRDIAPICNLARARVPAYYHRIRYTTLERARAQERLGRRDQASAARREIERLDRGTSGGPAGG